MRELHWGLGELRKRMLLYVIALRVIVLEGRCARRVALRGVTLGLRWGVLRGDFALGCCTMEIFVPESCARGFALEELTLEVALGRVALGERRSGIALQGAAPGRVALG